MLLLLYADDISLAYASSAIKAVDNIKAKLAAKYRITNLGPARQFLGIETTSASTNSYTVCVILYFYPATCGPKGHGSGSAAAYCSDCSCFYIPVSLSPRPA